MAHSRSVQLIGSLGTFRNKIKEIAEVATKSYIEDTVLKRFKTPDARAKYISEMFAYNSKHEHDPFLWRRWQVSDVPTGYKKSKTTKATVTTSTKTKSARITAKDPKASKSQYCVVIIVLILSSIPRGAEIVAIAS